MKRIKLSVIAGAILFMSQSAVAYTSEEIDTMLTNYYTVAQWNAWLNSNKFVMGLWAEGEDSSIAQGAMANAKMYGIATGQGANADEAGVAQGAFTNAGKWAVVQGYNASGGNFSVVIGDQSSGGEGVVAIGTNVKIEATATNTISFFRGEETRSNVFNIGNRRLVGLSVPVDDTDGATKGYVDTLFASVAAGDGSGADLSNYYNKTEIHNIIDSIDGGGGSSGGLGLTEKQAAALGATDTEVSLTKASSVTGNVHGIYITDTETIITGGTTSTQMTLGDDTVDFKHVESGNPVRLTGVADGEGAFDAVNVRQMNEGNAKTLSSANAYTDMKAQETLEKANEEAAKGVALALALSQPLSFHGGSNAMAIGAGSYKGQNAISLKFGKVVNKNTYWTAGVAYNGSDTAVNASVGFSW